MKQYRGRYHCVGTVMDVVFTGKSQFLECKGVWETFLAAHDPEPFEWVCEIINEEDTTLIYLTNVSSVQFTVVEIEED